VNTSALRAAYDAFLQLATTGTFGPDPADGWGADRVLAHMAVNDGLLAATTRQLLDDDPSPAYDNALSQDSGNLDAFAKSVGGRAGLPGAVRKQADRLMSLIEQLDDQRADTALPVRIKDGDEYVIDGPTPWSRIVRAQHAFHVPAHTDQLRELLA
jgi:hypothetical protein